MRRIARCRRAIERVFRPRRTIWPTRDGWWTLLVVVGLGIAAIVTGNNLLYLLVSLVLGLIVVSGVLSELTLRGLEVAGVEPEAIHAGEPARIGARLVNRRRWLASHSIAIEGLSPTARPRGLHVTRLGAGESHLATWEDTLPRRGVHQLAGVRIATRFPFGFFLKAGQPVLRSEVVVFPALRPVSPELARWLSVSGQRPAGRRGGGTDLYTLRGYRPGDDPRLIHWRSSAKAQALTVRDREAETTLDTRVILAGAGDGKRLETGLSEAASLCAHLIRMGAGVELSAPGLFLPLGRGRAHLDRMLRALALWSPIIPGDRAPEGDLAGESRGPLRQIHVSLD
jgi:uncharacterized protein (DUF58 family)